MPDGSGPHPEALEGLVRRITAQVRWRRAEHYALRGAFYGAVAGVVALVLKVAFGAWALVAAGALVPLGLAAGAVWGLAKRVSPTEAAGLADRASGLQDRVATALEWSNRPDRPRLVAALVADATARVGAVEPRQIVPRVLPREVWWLPVPALAALVLALGPPVPLLTGRFPDLSPLSESEEPTDRSGGELVQQDRRSLPKDALRKPPFDERDFVQRAGTGGAATAGGPPAIFKETALGPARPGFKNFPKKSDQPPRRA